MGELLTPVVLPDKRRVPLLLRSELTGRVFVVTAYRMHGDVIEALIKYDVTEQFEALTSIDGSTP